MAPDLSKTCGADLYGPRKYLEKAKGRAPGRPNWTISTQENHALFGRRTAGLYRTMQLGFRVLF